MKLKFLGSDDEDLKACFRVGRMYEAHASEWGEFGNGFYNLDDDNHEPWMVDVTTGEWEVID